jgi:hypothetical protein
MVRGLITDGVVLTPFSRDERRRAEAVATDPRIRIALNTPDAGITQVLAGATSWSSGGTTQTPTAARS